MHRQNHRYKIISKLIDRLESSSSSKRIISLPFTKKFYPDYFSHDDHSARDEINAAAESLSRDGIVTIKWKKFLEGHELSRIILNTDAVQKAYSEINRVPMVMIVENAVNIINDTYITAPKWLATICEDALSAFKAGKSFFSIKVEDTEKINYVFKSLRAIASLNGNTILKRKLSINALNDSKAFSNIESTITHILKSYGIAEGETEREILESVGIITRPDITLISGNIKIQTKQEIPGFHPSVINLQSFPYLGIPTSVLKDIVVTDIKADYVITIENETSFHEYISNVNEKFIAIFLSGYPNSGRISLLKAISNFATSHNINLPFFHWGDIDFGGYDIIRSYREKTGINVLPHLMGAELVEKSQYAVKLENTKVKKLEEFITKNKFQDLTNMALRLLKIGKRLEQESIEARGVTNR